jgi:ATP-dependent RNA helicase DHX36
MQSTHWLGGMRNGNTCFPWLSSPTLFFRCPSQHPYRIGDARAVTLYKQPRRKTQQQVFELPLSLPSLASLDAYFTAHPPSAAELAAITAASEGGVDGGLAAAYGSDSGGSSEEEDEGDAQQAQQSSKGAGKAAQLATAQLAQQEEAQPAARRRRGKSGATPAARFDRAEVARRLGVWEQRIMRREMEGLIEGRASLPIADFREEILSVVDLNQVVMVAGETGCGKTTQVCVRRGGERV